MPELSMQLKQLRLSYMLESLAQRNQEAIQCKATYAEFLALLVQDEILGREGKKLQRHLRHARIQSNKTFENYDFSFNPKINQLQIKELASCRFIAEKVGVLIVGPCGTGKSHIAQAIAHSAIRLGIEALWLSQARLFHELQTARATGRFDKKFAELTKVPLLIIDDFGLRPLRTPQDEDLHEIVSERYERYSTIVTSNLDFSEWGSAFPNQLLAAATLDRLQDKAYRVVLDGKSYRNSQEFKCEKQRSS